MISFTTSALITIAALGGEADWVFTENGNAFWQGAIEPNGGISFDGGHEGDAATMTGCAAEVLDAAVPDEAAFEITLSNPSDAGTLFVVVKDGDPIEFVFPNGGSEITRAGVSGTGSGMSITAGDDSPQSQINDILIKVEV